MAPEIERILQRSLDAIETNLRAQISVQELCADAGFSLSQFYRLFEAATGMSVGRYITRRRLLHAVYAMSRGMDATAAALEYGFDTHAGFYKAFRREFGCAPTVYLRTHQAARPARVHLKEVAKMVHSKQIARVLSAWGLEGETTASVYYANTGYQSENTLYVGNSLVLKWSDSLGLMQRQAQLQRALFEHDLAAPVVPAKDGREIVRDEETDFMLMERVQGAPFNALRAMENPQEAQAVGEGLARLHAVLRECDPLLCEEEDLLKTLREWAVPAAQKAMNLEEGWTHEYLNRFALVYPSLPCQIVHRDPNPDNILMDGNRVVGFLDFELSRILPRIFDVCYAATGVLVDTFSTIAPQKRLDAFFAVAKELWQGYDRAAGFTPQERRALPDMVIAIQLICVAAFTGVEKFAQLAEENQKMLRMILDNMDRF